MNNRKHQKEDQPTKEITPKNPKKSRNQNASDEEYSYQSQSQISPKTIKTHQEALLVTQLRL